jgi:hypothetical protein
MTGREAPLMHFEGALSCLRAGHRVGRVWWAPTVWLSMKPRSVIQFTARGAEEEWRPTQADILAGDWEIVL